MDNHRDGPRVSRSDIAEVVLSCLQEVLSLREDNLPSLQTLGEPTRLIGSRGVLDSMGLVTLVVDVEQTLEEEHGLVVILADDRAMSQKNSPFRSVESLTDYVCQLVEEQG